VRFVDGAEPFRDSNWKRHFPMASSEADLARCNADQKNAALHTAAKSGLRDAVILLLANGADPNAPDTDTGETPLIALLNWGLELSGCTPPFVSRENIVAILIEDGADVNARGGEEESSLHAALAMRG